MALEENEYVQPEEELQQDEAARASPESVAFDSDITVALHTDEHFQQELQTESLIHETDAPVIDPDQSDQDRRLLAMKKMAELRLQVSYYTTFHAE